MRDAIEYLQELVKETEPQCTCEEESKHRALCPVCDKEEYDKQKELAKKMKEPFKK